MRWMMVRWILVTTIVQSSYQYVYAGSEALQYNAPTVCSLTINSDDEVKVFKRYLQPQGFRFIELAPNSLEQSYASGEHWIKKSCSPKIKCDVLLISGHYMGTFFGDKGFTANYSDLQDASCNSNCSGLFEYPKEVFLFGCNTMAGKDRDSRSPEQYLQVLLNDHISVPRSEMGVAIRYTGIGADFGSGTLKLFPKVPLIYGFHGIAPSGRSVAPMLNQYFKQVGDYQKHLAKVESGQIQSNQVLQNALKLTTFRQAKGVVDENRFQQCEAISADTPISKKLATIQTAIKSEGTRSFGLIQTLMQHHADKSSFDQESRNILITISSDASVGGHFFQAINRYKELIPTVVASLLEMSDYLEVIDKNQIRSFKVELLNRQMKRMNIPEQRINTDSKKLGLEFERIEAFASAWKDFDSVLSDLPIESYPKDWFKHGRFLVFLLNRQELSDQLLDSVIQKLFVDKGANLSGVDLMLPDKAYLSRILWKHKEKVDRIYGPGFVFQKLISAIKDLSDQELFGNIVASDKFILDFVRHDDELAYRKWMFSLKTQNIWFEYWPKLTDKDLANLLIFLQNPAVNHRAHFMLSLILLTRFESSQESMYIEILQSIKQKFYGSSCDFDSYCLEAMNVLRFDRNVTDFLDQYRSLKSLLLTDFIEPSIFSFKKGDRVISIVAELLYRSGWSISEIARMHIEEMQSENLIDDLSFVYFVGSDKDWLQKHHDFLLTRSRSDDFNTAYAVTTVMAKHYPNDEKYRALSESFTGYLELAR